MKNLLLLFFFFSFGAFSKELKTNFLIFGDSGYHQSFQDEKEKDGLTMEEWKKEAINDGEVIGKKPLLPPMVPNPFKIKHYHKEGGAFYVGKAMKNFCEKNSCEFSLMLGDNIYPNGARGDKEDEKIFRHLIYLPLKNIEKKNKDFRFYVIMGNHDWYSHEYVPENLERMKKLSFDGIYSQMEYYARPGSRFILNPESTDPKRKTYYKFSTHNGRVEIFALDTMRIISGLPVKDYKDPNKLAKNFNPTPKEELEEQINWLKESLKNSKADWKIVMGHHPLYSVGGSKWQEAISLREQILPSLCQYADIYLAGHEHDLEYHSAPCEGLPDLELLISGAASKQRSVNVNPSSKNLIKEQRKEYKFAKGMIWGFAHMSIKNDSAEVKLLEVSRKGTYKTIFKRSFNRRFKPAVKK
jgi:tartrate-resistant acid phosphatase type 5